MKRWPTIPLMVVVAVFSSAGDLHAQTKTVTGSSSSQFNVVSTTGGGYTIVTSPGSPFEVYFNASNLVSSSAVVDGGGSNAYTVTNGGLGIQSTGGAGVFLSSTGGGTVINLTSIIGALQGVNISNGFGSVTNSLVGTSAGAQPESSLVKAGRS
ncbi:MAG: hypothetical protein QM755_06335 [Luteolibacter sp.]